MRQLPLPRAWRVLIWAAAFLLFPAGRLVAADLHQVSTMEALAAGLYEGRERFAELTRHGDFGLGTLANLDGEMVLLDGVPYQIRSDATVHRVRPDAQTPFAQVVFFTGSLDLGRVDGLTLDALKDVLRSRLPDPSRFYAVRVNGAFTRLVARSVPAQQKPWPPIVEAIKAQSVFPMEHVQGTMVGIYTPPGQSALSATGWHFHFLSADRTRGGHVLEAILGPAKARGDCVQSLTVLFPEHPLPAQAAPRPAAGTE